MTRRIRNPAAALAALLLALAAGCGPAPRSPLDQAVAAAIQRYNEVLPGAYARADAGALAPVATPGEMQRVEDLIGFLAQGRMIMDARQESFELRGHAREEGSERASAEVTEVWWYRHVVPATGEVKQAPRRVRYANRYLLVRVEGRWLVDRLVETGFEDLR
jgi:hypothetical protein